LSALEVASEALRETAAINSFQKPEDRVVKVHTNSTLTVSLDGELLTKDGSIGIPVPSTELKCVDEKGKQVPIGEPGELVARGPQIMLGYWQREEETKAALKDGWLKTGDIGFMDADGFFTIVDRKKDMILVSGFNVYPNEVEDQIALVPGVLEVGVVGAPDERSGERVQAYVVASEKAPSAEEIIKACRANLAAYKIPQDIFFVDELPKSPIGKILRRELRANLSGSSKTNSAVRKESSK
jgi:long-chain acyl-CoA synthetase